MSVFYSVLFVQIVTTLPLLLVSLTGVVVAITYSKKNKLIASFLAAGCLFIITPYVFGSVIVAYLADKATNGSISEYANYINWIAAGNSFLMAIGIGLLIKAAVSNLQGKYHLS